MVVVSTLSKGVNEQGIYVSIHIGVYQNTCQTQRKFKSIYMPKICMPMVQIPNIFFILSKKKKNLIMFAIGKFVVKQKQVT